MCGQPGVKGFLLRCSVAGLIRSNIDTGRISKVMAHGSGEKTERFQEYGVQRGDSSELRSGSHRICPAYKRMDG